MFLALTALEEYWDKNQSILFLGEWCKLYNRRSVIDQLVSETLPYHWESRNKLCDDYRYLTALYERLLGALCKDLNHIHGVAFPERYWRIILGFWLHWFISIVFDRYESLRIAENSGKVTSTFIAPSRPGLWTPKDYANFAHLSERIEGYTHYIFSRIIERSSRLPYTIREHPDNTQERITQQPRASLQTYFGKALRRMLKIWDRNIAGRLSRVYLTPYNLGLLNHLKLQLLLFQVPFSGLIHEQPTPDEPFDGEKRRHIAVDCIAQNDFERILIPILREQIPRSFVEEYKDVKTKAMLSYPPSPAVILSVNELYDNEQYRFWAADAVSKGTKLACAQHGGLYGAALFFFCEEYEISISDRYYSWGWKDARRNVKPLPSSKLARHSGLRSDPDGKILLVTSLSGRHSYHLYSEPIGASGYLAHMEDQYTFIDHLDEGARDILMVRLYPHDRGKWFQRERYNDRYPDVECYQGNDSMYDQLRQSRLFVCTYNSTTYLETFTADFPTVMFWAPQYWELRPSAQPYFDKLRSVGILHDTPESAADLINTICQDPLSWWRTPAVQEAKNEFCHEFARTSKDWLKEWKTELRQLESA